jgi:diketogulonate reductase-like aldo/keto reductase
MALSKQENSGLILHTGALIDSVNSAGLANFIEDLLTKAESIAAHEYASTKNEVKLVDDQKEAIIEAAANKLGMPIIQ